MAAFATPEDLELLLGHSLAEGRAELLLDLASGEIRTHLGQYVSLVEDDVLVRRGTWDSELRLPEQPVTDVSAVEVDGTALTAGQYVSLPGGVVQAGFGGNGVTVRITYTHGFADGSPQLEVCRAVALEAAAAAAENPTGVVSETIDGYSVSYSRARDAGVGLTPPQLDRLDRIYPGRGAGSIPVSSRGSGYAPTDCLPPSERV